MVDEGRRGGGLKSCLRSATDQSEALPGNKSRKIHTGVVFSWTDRLCLKTWSTIEPSNTWTVRSA